MYEFEHEGKRVSIGTKEHFEDFIRYELGEEVWEAYKDLVRGEFEIEDLKAELEDTENARKRMEIIADGHYQHLVNVNELCGIMRKEITSSLRLNRKKLLSIMKEIENEVE